MHAVTIAIGLVSGVVVLVWLARRVNIPYPILLVLGGLALGFIPGLPRVQMRPDLIFLVFLPPLLMEESWGTSWRDFRRNLRPISLLAIGLVFVTTAAVAAVAHYAINGFSWAAGFVLGAIVAPTDELAAAVVASRLRIPRRIVTVIEDESLVNDASSLVIYRLASASVVAGAFSLLSGAIQFVYITVVGIAVGLLVGWVFAKILNRLDDPSIEITITLLIPFISYLVADHINASGVLAVVATGLYLGRRAGRIQSSRTHIEADAVWEMLAFILNGVLFFLMGLQLRGIVSGLGGYSVLAMVGYAALISVVVIVVRIAWVFPAAYLPRRLSARIRKNDPYPPWQWIAILSWTGVRGAISLAAALAIPLTIHGGAPYPERGPIIFITYGVILATLVLQGLSLPPLIRWLGVRGDGASRREENKARVVAARAGLARLNDVEAQGWAPQKALDDLRSHLDKRNRLYSARYGGEADGVSETYHQAYYRLRDELLRAQREAVISLRDEGVISDQVLHRVQHELDLEALQLDGGSEEGTGESVAEPDRQNGEENKR
ncbi:MAG TPA: Na+/H+ antiporter [Capsulimonadaceae bacterium]|nr:Na+/H+ antiporter [Capsulimonadaceae bacterium]